MEYWFSKYYPFPEFRMKYFMDIEILNEIIFVISSSNSNANIVVTYINNILSNINSNRSTKVYNFNNNYNNINSFSNNNNYNNSNSVGNNNNYNNCNSVVYKSNSIDSEK